MIFGIDYISPINAVLTTVGAAVSLLILYYANQWIMLQKRKHADSKIEAAITVGIAQAIMSEPEPEKRLEKAKAYVETVVPEELKLLKVDAPVIEEKIKARASASRGIII